MLTLVPDANWLTAAALFCGGFALAAIISDYLMRFRKRGLDGLKTRASLTGMLLAHAGYIVMALAITATGLYSNEQDLRVRAGQSIDMAGYRITLLDFRDTQGVFTVAVPIIVFLYPIAITVVTLTLLDATILRNLTLRLGFSLPVWLVTGYCILQLVIPAWETAEFGWLYPFAIGCMVGTTLDLIQQRKQAQR